MIASVICTYWIQPPGDFLGTLVEGLNSLITSWWPIFIPMIVFFLGLKLFPAILRHFTS